MNSDRWKRIEQIYYSVLASPPRSRAAILEQLCPDDQDIRNEVASLLNAREQAGNFLSPEDFQGHVAELTEPDLAGCTLGHYQIVSPVGAGAMGEVYLARDVRLDRQVALKMLPPQFICDSERVARFQREAKAASALSHTNIVTIYEIGESGGVWFIAEEMVDGVTLRDRMAQGRMPPSEAIETGLQCAMALEAAHRASIVHRDIKPENIMMRSDGMVKIVDFGLARIGEAGQTSPQTTQAGSVMGTPRYMSPEQARGEKLDGRSDIFSLGAVLYEMLTAEPAFPGTSTAEVFAALLDSQPVVVSGGRLSAVLSKALAKHREARYQSMSEFAEDLRKLDPRQSNRLLTAPARPPIRTVFKRYANKNTYFAAALVLVCVLLAWRREAGHLGSVQQPPNIVPLTTFAGSKDYSAFSPDAKRIAFSWNGGSESDEQHIYVKPVSEGDPIQLTNSTRNDILPSWSPDGQCIAFCRKVSRLENAIFIIPSTGGAERKIASGGMGVSWSPDGKWLALANLPQPQGSGGLYVLSRQTGHRREVTAPRNASDGYPAYSPDGRWIAFTRVQLDTSIFREVFIVPARGGAARRLTSDSNPKLGRVAWTADSREIVYSAQREHGGAGLWRVSIGGGEPQRTYSTLDFAGNPAISAKGNRLAYTESWIDTNIYRSDGPGFSASGVPGRFGEPQKVIDSSREDHSPNLSRDGQRIAFVSNRTGHSEIWTSRLDGTQQKQLTNLEGFAGTPRWSPDGQWIAFDYITHGYEDIGVVSATASAPPRRLTTDPASDTKPSWSPDGVWIYFNSDRSGRPEIWKIKADGTAATQLTRNGGREPLPSTDGKLVYYTKGFNGAPIWSVPSGGGPEQPVSGMEAFNRIGRMWGVLEQGIYFVSWETGAPREKIRFFSFATGRVGIIGDCDGRTRSTTPDLVVSADGRHLVTVNQDQQINDLMMIQNFR